MSLLKIRIQGIEFINILLDRFILNILIYYFTLHMKYEFTFENLSWDFLRAISKTGYDTNTEQMLEQMANVHFIKALNAQNGSAYYLEENRNQYMQVMTQLHPETPEEILWVQIGKKYPDIANKYKKRLNEWIYRCDMTEITPFWKA